MIATKSPLGHSGNPLLTLFCLPVSFQGIETKTLSLHSPPAPVVVLRWIATHQPSASMGGASPPWPRTLPIATLDFFPPQDWGRGWFNSPCSTHNKSKTQVQAPCPPEGADTAAFHGKITGFEYFQHSNGTERRKSGSVLSACLQPIWGLPPN